MVTPGSEKEGRQGRIEVRTRWRERGSTTSQGKKDIDGKRRQEKKEEGGIESGGGARGGSDGGTREGRSSQRRAAVGSSLQPPSALQ